MHHVGHLPRIKWNFQVKLYTRVLRRGNLRFFLDGVAVKPWSSFPLDNKLAFMENNLNMKHVNYESEINSVYITVVLKCLIESN